MNEGANAFLKAKKTYLTQEELIEAYEAIECI